MRTYFTALLLTVAACTNQAPPTDSVSPPAAPPAMHTDHSTASMPTAPAALRKGTSVKFPSSTPGASGYLSLPAASTARKPAIIVIQEWWGVTDWIRQNTDRFAEQGYVSLAVDLYRGSTATDASVAHELMRGLPEDRAMADLKGAFEYLASRPDVDPARIGVIGWCMGGGYSLALATSEPRLAAAVINYGRLVTDGETIGKIRTPILGNFGGTDRGIPPESVRTFESALKAARVPNEIKIYPAQGHGFMNPNNREGYSEEATADGWRRIDAFFARHLKNRT